MSKIHVLADSTINKIAAGEVVERPASVIKELVENSIDAGATRIEVEFMAGGTSLMRVSDNGHGMSLEDARLAIKRHATSKIRDVEDIYNISTLGFRGEALPTIASVSRFTLLTREPDADLGTAVVISGKEEPQITETGCSTGTTIKVEDLFFNTPARKKFLKTTHTEGSKINDFIVKLAVSRPDIAFRLISNNKLSLTTPGNGSLYDTLGSIYGGKVSDALLALNFTDEAEQIKITGYISKPSLIRSNRSWQTFIVNGRVISNKAVAKAVDNAYHSMIPKVGYPLVAVCIDVPPQSIDVNVHPQKSELKFADEGRIFKAVYKAVLDAVRPADDQLQGIAAGVEKAERYTGQGMSYQQESLPVSQPSFAAAGRSTQEVSSFVPSYQRQQAFQLPPTEKVQDFSAAQQVIRQEKQIEEYAVNPEIVAKGVADAPAVQRDNFGSEGGLLPIGQVDKTYIIAQDSKGLYIIDQHAAHERILYDKFAAQAEKIPSQQLLVHLILDFSAKETALIAENKELFQKLGFSLEESGEQQFRLIEVPADVPVSEAENILREILTGLQNLHQPTSEEIRHACLATTACRAAIKAGENLNMRQMEIILQELSRTPRPYTCPHGRPTIIKFTSDELAKMFKRTGFF